MERIQRRNRREAISMADVMTVALDKSKRAFESSLSRIGLWRLPSKRLC